MYKAAAMLDPFVSSTYYLATLLGFSHPVLVEAKVWADADVAIVQSKTKKRRCPKNVAITSVQAASHNRNIDDPHQLRQVFEHQAFEVSMSQLIQAGFLCKVQCYRVLTFTDISLVVPEDKEGEGLSDFNERELSKLTVERHKRGDFDVLVNVQILTEGYDDTSINCILMVLPETR
ncbi:hypothetical protein HaLaN_06238 [Haematococcus lacustris]|uniref:Uncharacterized protein n=1 Tax=Haematococcus lacustris TaxID=44745 RepID=A0A699YNF6_HAELA|nr:hypothetical protein HaLaN_06238 [Haematococcus lacustris]